MNEDTPVGVASAVKEGLASFVVDMTVEIEKLSSLKDTTVVGSFPPLSTLVTNSAGNALGKSSCANVTRKPSRKKLNIHTLFTPGGKWVAYPIVANYVRNTWGKYGLVRSIFSSSTGLFSFQFSSMEGLDAMLENDFNEDGLSAIATKLGTPLMFDSYTSDMCMQSWGRSSYARVMIELQADVELKDNIILAMPKIIRESHYICNVCVEYEWKPPRCVYCKVFIHTHKECLKNTGVGEKKTLKKPSQTSQGVPVGPKMDFKPQKEYRPGPKKSNASSSGNKNEGVVPTIEVSNLNPFKVLNSVDNAMEQGTNGGTTNLVNNKATLSGSSFMIIDHSSTMTTPIIDKIRKFEELLTSGKATLVDGAGNPLKKV
nr:hypothetical protein [Tanacetum cinerariifolium]